MLKILADKMIKRLPHDRYLRRAHEASEFHQQIFVTSKKKKKQQHQQQNKTKTKNKKVYLLAHLVDARGAALLAPADVEDPSPAATPVQLNRNRSLESWGASMPPFLTERLDLCAV